MEKCMNDFDTKMSEAGGRLENGVEELEHEIDGAMYQFVVKRNNKEGTKRTERAVRRMKAVAKKCTFEINEAKKLMCSKVREYEREGQRRENELKLSLAADEVELEEARKKRKMDDEEVQTAYENEQQ